MLWLWINHRTDFLNLRRIGCCILRRQRPRSCSWYVLTSSPLHGWHTRPREWNVDIWRRPWPQGVAQSFSAQMDPPRPGIIVTCSRLVAEPGCWEIGARHLFLNMIILHHKWNHKHYSLLFTVFRYMFFFRAPGKHLDLSPQNALHVWRRSRLTCSRFPCLFYKCFPGGPK